jgi:hypothetical protein
MGTKMAHDLHQSAGNAACGHAVNGGPGIRQRSASSFRLFSCEMPVVFLADRHPATYGRNVLNLPAGNVTCVTDHDVYAVIAK